MAFFIFQNFFNRFHTVPRSSIFKPNQCDYLKFHFFPQSLAHYAKHTPILYKNYELNARIASVLPFLYMILLRQITPLRSTHTQSIYFSFIFLNNCRFFRSLINAKNFNFKWKIPMYIIPAKIKYNYNFIYDSYSP